MGLASSHMASLKAWGEFQNNVDSQFLLIPNRHIVHSLKVWLPTDRPAGALPYIRTLRPKTIASADNRPQQLQNMSLLWFCMVVCCLRSQLLCVILGGRFGNLETAVWGGRCMTLHGILGLSTSRWFVSGSNSEGPSSQVTWEVLVPLHAGSSKLQVAAAFWRLLSVWQTSCPPWFHGWSPETCEFHSVSFRVLVTNHPMLLFHNRNTGPRLSPWTTSASMSMTSFLKQKPSKNGYHSAIISHRASPVGQQWNSHTIVLMLLSLPLHGAGILAVKLQLQVYKLCRLEKLLVCEIGVAMI